MEYPKFVLTFFATFATIFQILWFNFSTETIAQPIPQEAPPPQAPADTVEPLSPPELPQDPPEPLPDPQLQTSPSEGTLPCREATPESPKFFVQSIQVSGATVLQEEIQEITQPYENQTLTFETLICLRSEITELYIKNGYITSGAFIPNNQLLGEGSDGIVEIQVVEGELERIEIEGLKRLKKSYVRSRLNALKKPPLNQALIEKRLQLLQLDSHLQQVNAELTSGSAPAKSVLRLTLKEDQAFDISARIDNYRSPSVGSIQGTVSLSHNNVLGFGDRFSGSYGKTAGLDLFDLSYEFPINAKDGSVGIRFNNSDSDIVTDTFDDVDISSETRTLSGFIRQPIIKTPTQEFTLGLALDLRRSQTFLENQPFPFSLGATDDGVTKVTVLRFSQDWLKRSPRSVLSARSQFSFGLNALDATVNNTGTDARFVSWLGQAQWVQRLSERNLLLTRLDAQITPDALLPLEQFGLGGVYSIRGYRQNQLVTDNAVQASIEARIPVTKNPDRLQLVPFFEVGTGWNNQANNPAPATLVGIGVGVRWLIHSGLLLRVDYGVPLITVGEEGNSLQENGLYFSLQYQP